MGDITYLWTDEGWLYLAVIIDLYARRVVGWAMADRMTADLVCDALMMALWHRWLPRGVIVHSEWVFTFGRNGCSAWAGICTKGNCYDNACAESFFHTLKVEVIHGERFPTRTLMRQTVFEGSVQNSVSFLYHSAKRNDS